jgi:integrase
MQNHDEQKRGDSRSGKAKSRRGSGSRPNVGSFYRQRWITQQIKAKLLEEGHPEECRICGAKADRGLIFDRADLKLGTYFDGWLKDVRNTVRQRTWERYESIVRVHIKPALGAAKLQALTPNHLRALYRDKLDAGLAPRTVNYIHVTLHKALKDTVSDGLVPNYVAAVKSPRPEKPEIHPLSRVQARRLLDAASKQGDRFEALYIVAMHCGLREGELLGLRWEDLNLDAGTLAVRRTLSETRTGHKFELPKNGKVSSVKLSQRAVEALKSHRAHQNEERLKAGSLWQDHDLVFPTGIGTTMSGTNLTGRHFKPLLTKAGLPAIRLHDLRHTCATILLMAGKHPKYVQELLGHASISITLDTYSHVVEGMDGGLAEAMDEAL